MQLKHESANHLFLQRAQILSPFITVVIVFATFSSFVWFCSSRFPVMNTRFLAIRMLLQALRQVYLICSTQSYQDVSSRLEYRATPGERGFVRMNSFGK